MHRSTVPLSLAIGLVCAGIAGCLSDLEDLCQTDADCPAGGRCAVEDGFRYCIPGPGAGGNGGTGGVGGSGGGAAEFEAIVDLELLPDEELADFLERIPRRVDAVTLHYLSGGGERTVKVPLEEPSALPLASLTLRLSLASQSEALTIDVTAHVTLKNDEPGTLATGQLEAEFAADQTHPVSVRLSLNHDFDWDGDDDPDITDCGPDDPAVHHGAIDFCDGTQQACGQSFCLIPLEDNLTVRDLACSLTERKCAAVLTNGEKSVVRIYDSEFQATEVEGIDNPQGITWSEPNRALLIGFEDRIRLSNPTGQLLDGAVLPSRTFGSIIRTLSSGEEIGVAKVERRKEFDAFFPGRAIHETVECNIDDTACKTVSVTTLSDSEGSPLAEDAALSDIAIHRIGTSFPLVYLTFLNDSRLGVVRLDDENLSMRAAESGLIKVLEGSEPLRALALSSKSILFAARGTSPDNSEAAFTNVRSTYQQHEAPEAFALPQLSCPAVIDVIRNDSALLMADDCTGSLWELPLDEEGRPTGAEPIHHPLGDECKKPFKLASLPAAGDEKALTFVGCEGESHILVHNRN